MNGVQGGESGMVVSEEAESQRSWGCLAQLWLDGKMGVWSRRETGLKGIVRAASELNHILRSKAQARLHRVAPGKM